MALKITINGSLGSGKSVLRDNLVKHYGFIPYSTGVLQREIAEKKGMTVLELNKYSETHPEIDEYIDNGLRELSNSIEKYIIDSRLAWHFVRPSFKVYLKIDPQVAAERVMKATNRDATESYQSVSDAAKALLERAESENSRFIEKYGVNCLDMKNYDLIVDTTMLTPIQVLEKVIEKYNLENM